MSTGIRVQDHALVEMKPFLEGQPLAGNEPPDGELGQDPLVDQRQPQQSPPIIATRITRIGASVHQPQLDTRASKGAMGGKQPHGQDKAIFPTTEGLLSFSLNHLFVLVVCVSFVVISLLPFEAYSAHILFGCLSWVSLNLSITLLQQSQPRTQKVLSTWHWQINVLALLCFIATFVIMFVSRQQKGKQHFDSTHAQVGLATIIYLLFVALFGSLVRFFPSAFGGPLKARYWNAWHRWGGYGMLILLYATLYLALTKKSTVKRMDSTVWWISLFALIFSALILFGRANWNRMIQSVVPKRQS